ncbi:MAG: J domain-containing protein, partial [Candidatus Saccharimonadales bacterium]
MESSFVDFYALLGVQPHVTTAELKKAYTLLAREHHPDVGGNDSQMQSINKAYQTLKDDTKR